MKSHDFIIFNDVLEHINVSKLDEAIKQCYSLLNDNGLLKYLPNSNGIFLNYQAFLSYLK